MAADRRDVVSWTAFGFGLLVACGAAWATAHGLYEVSRAAGVPDSVAWLYPLITDGLALVAYVSTARLGGAARTYAWAVVVLAAGLSGLAQAIYLAGGIEPAATTAASTAADGGDGPVPASPALRFGVGAWPAVAAAVAAHLLFLLAEARKPATDTHAAETSPQPGPPRSTSPVDRPQWTTTQAPAVRAATVQPPTVHESAQRREASAGVHRSPVQRPAVQPPRVQPSRVQSGGVQSRGAETGVQRSDVQRSLPSPASDRALAEARSYARTHGRLPTVSQLQKRADVARGTAGAVLKDLRDQPPGLHLVSDQDTDQDADQDADQEAEHGTAKASAEDSSDVTIKAQP